MEFIIPLLLLAFSALLVWGLINFLGRSAGTATNSTAAGVPPKKSPALFERMSQEGAVSAAQRMDEDTHQKVYRYLAVGQLAQAAEIYHRATGVGRIEAFVDVQALHQFPQEHAPEQQVPLEEVAGTDPFVPAAQDDGEQQVTDLVIPEEWLDQAEPEKTKRFEIQINRESETIAMSSEDLQPWIRDQISAMIRDERLDDAAETLTEHTVLEESEAQDLIKILAKQIHAAEEDTQD